MPSARRLGLLLVGLWLCLPSLCVQAADAPFLWEVRGPKARHALLGSVHLLPQDAYPLPLPLQAAYDDARGLVLETDVAALSEPALQKSMLAAATAEGGLKRQIDAALHQRVLRHFESAGLPSGICEPYKAWFCALTLELLALQGDGVSPDLGVDRHFFGQADADGKSVRWLETPQQQLSIFIDMSAAQSAEFLASALDELEDPKTSPAQVIEQWRRNDLSSLEQMVEDLRQHFPDIYQRLLAGRNRAWIAALNERFRGAEPQLVIVGAAHLVGPDGLPGLLRAQGFTVTKVECKPGTPAAHWCDARPRAQASD